MCKFLWKIAIVSLLSVVAAFSAVPQLMSYQGKLGGADSTPISGNVSITFTIYDAVSAGNTIWTETQASVSVKNGLFHVLLGSVTPIGDNVFADSVRYLGIQLGVDPEMTPRTRIASVGFAQRVGTVDGASGGGINGDLHVVGNVGIGVAPSARKLHVAGELMMSGGGQGWILQEQSNLDQHFFVIADANSSGTPARLMIDNDGRVGINTVVPIADLHVEGDAFVNRNVGIGVAPSSRKLHVAGEIMMSSGGQGWILQEQANLGQHYFVIADANSTGIPARFMIDQNGNVGIGTVTPSTSLDVGGTTTTQVLAITGGMDLAEPFETSAENNLPLGALVVIDDTSPGKLKLSSASYDTRVAGVVSGAGGIKPGLTLRQEGLIDGGQNIALSGRVYVLATATNGAIKPGDLLTTSDLAGYAMRATDRERSHGAVIGKAMSVLQSREGLVLVLVNLQ